jgi:hypothetical protein
MRRNPLGEAIQLYKDNFFLNGDCFGRLRIQRFSATRNCFGILCRQNCNRYLKAAFVEKYWLLNFVHELTESNIKA